MSYIDGFFDRNADAIRVVERKDGKRVFKEFPVRYTFFYEDPKGKYKKGEFKCRLVKIHNFGTFTLRKKKSRIGRNPKTKEEFVIPKRLKFIFKASSKIKNKLN